MTTFQKCMGIILVCGFIMSLIAIRSQAVENHLLKLEVEAQAAQYAHTHDLLNECLNPITKGK
jgi:hypothetical protein